LQEIEKEIRDVSHKLHTNLSSSEVNFTTIVDQLLKEKSTLGNFSYDLSIHKNVSWNKITELTKVHIYRIIQESLQNVVKHAQANKITLSFTQEKNVLYLEIIDNGIGFDTRKKKTGIGVKNIQSRIEKLSGKLEIVSEKNKGTTLKINLPIT
jgi:signal transduction histidine kinase